MMGAGRIQRGMLASAGLLLAGAQAFADEPAAPTWARDIAPILYRHCVECHRPGQVAPFSLLGHPDAAKRARFLAKAVKARVMPPWLPGDPAGTFLDERRLSDAEIGLLVRWAEAGAPAGDLAQAPVPPPAAGAKWHLGTPDLVVRMRRPFAVPPGPEDSYEVFTTPYSVTGVPADVLARARIPESDVYGVAAIEIRPGNLQVFHHADIWVDLSGTARKREDAAGGNGFASFGTPGFVPAVGLGGRVPGMTARFLPPGLATSVLPPAGDIAFQVHYRATGRPQEDQSELGIYLMREPVKRVIESVLVRSFSLDIPAGEPAFAVEDTFELPAECIVMNVLPHMHLLGREVRVEAVLPDGSRRPLIDIRRWNFKWQDRYVYQEPIVLPKGTRLHGRWVFDNSATNPNNPFSPPQPVRFGPNATDEMCAVYFGIIPVNLDEAELFPAAVEKHLREKIAELTPEQQARHDWGEALGR